MDRIKLKRGGKCRPKAIFGIDGAIQAAATTAAAIMQSKATVDAAKEQSKAIVQNAETQSQTLEKQTENNNTLQQKSISFTRQQNEENRKQQQDIQTTLQMLAGQQNANDRMETNKVAYKYGGKTKRRSIKHQLSYGGGNKPFKVTDGGDAIPLQIDENGYGIYELYGNDHEHYHKAQGGKNKTGVGIKFNDGSVVEGEGNQNTNKGELLYVTPDDALFLSKHNIDGFNPADAVKQGLDPKIAFNTQELLKMKNGLNDDGTKAKCGTRKSLKKYLGGFDVLNPINNLTQSPNNNTGNIATGVAYLTSKDNDSSMAKCGKRVSLKRKKAGLGAWLKNNWNDYGGAVYNTLGQFGGAAISTIGNMYASNKLGKAYTRAGEIVADAYSKMHGIDLDEIKREDYDAPHTMAAVRSADTNINPQLERIRRDAVSETREVNRGTLSSAARQQRLAGINDRQRQRMSEQYAYKHNADEQIKQDNNARINQTAQANADRDVEARRDWGNQRLALLQYNNDIENTKLAGMAQARADALTQASETSANAWQASAASIGNALSDSADAFSSVYDGLRTDERNRRNLLIGVDTDNEIRYLIQNINVRGNRDRASNLYNSWINSSNKKFREYARQLKEAYQF